jgi:cytochrome c peroxidase
LPQDDTGRFRLTFDPDDVYVFKSPSLRNVALTPPYFHSGKVWKLSDAVRIMGSIQLGMRLEVGEIEHITAFLQTLNGEQPRLELPILPPNSGSTPCPSLEKTTGSSMGY